jgi:transcriptional regulator
MYIPKHFEEPRIDVMQKLICDYPLATLVILSTDGLNANHIPLHLADDGSPYGSLRGHVARANPLWSDFDKISEVLAIFQSESAYISPSWYATKKETGKVVPTWNYAAVHAHGHLKVIDDPVWIRSQLETMTAEHEATLPQPWTLSDAPTDFTERVLGLVVGIEINVVRLLGKWKVSQNQPPANREGVIKGLHESDQPEMAALVAAGPTS